MSAFSLDKSLNVAEKIASGETGIPATKEQWQEAIDKFNNSPEKSDEYESNKLALEVIPVILSAGETAKAEEFFLQSCMGKVGDLECAKLIVSYYKEQEKTEAGEKFIERCSKMRYPSDKKKLAKLLK